MYFVVLFINFYIIRYGDTVKQNKGTFSCLIRTNDFGKSHPAQCMGRRSLHHWHKSSGACSLLNCISITDGTETNEQNKSIATGLFYAHSEFDAFQHSYVEKCEILTCWISNLGTDGM